MVNGVGEVKGGVYASFLPHGNLFRETAVAGDIEELGVVGRNHWVVFVAKEERRMPEGRIAPLMDRGELEKFITIKPVGEEPDERFNRG